MKQLSRIYVIPFELNGLNGLFSSTLGDFFLIRGDVLTTLAIGSYKLL